MKMRQEMCANEGVMLWELAVNPLWESLGVFKNALTSCLREAGVFVCQLQ